MQVTTINHVKKFQAIQPGIHWIPVLEAMRGFTLWMLIVSLPLEAGEITTGGLEFAPASGEMDCFEAGDTSSSCPFKLVIKLDKNQAVANLMTASNMADIQKNVSELMASAMSGSTRTGYSITLPSVNYQAGVFKHVLIDGPGGRSITPDYCRGEYKPDSEDSGLTGRVEIEEFTPYLLSGRFSASLYERLEKLPQGRGFRCNSKPVDVTGHFEFSLPLLYDERIELETSEDDITLAYGIAVWQAAQPPGFKPAAFAPPETPIQQTETVSDPDEYCKCECEELLSPDVRPGCVQYCRLEGVVCGEEQASSDGELDQPSHGGDLDQQLKELESMGYPPELLEMIRGMLEDASPEERQSLLETYKAINPNKN